jgi:hypothetical protein
MAMGAAAMCGFEYFQPSARRKIGWKNCWLRGKSEEKKTDDFRIDQRPQKRKRKRKKKHEKESPSSSSNQIKNQSFFLFCF